MNPLTTLLNQASHHRSGAVVTSLTFYAFAVTLLLVRHPVLALLALVTGIIADVTMRRRDALRRRVSISYALPAHAPATPEQLQAVRRHTQLVDRWPALLRADGLWRRVGATLIDVVPGYERPRHLQLDAEIPIPSLRTRDQSLFFLPDRVLVYDHPTRDYASTSYAELRVTAAQDTLDLYRAQTGLRWELVISRPGTAQMIASTLELDRHIPA